jgi:hypothetical protein
MKMKISISKSILCLALLMPAFCRGELLFFNGNVKTDLAGDQSEARQSWRAKLVVDLDAGKMAKFNYIAASGGLKLFTVEAFEGFQRTQVTVGKSKTNSILVAAELGVNSNSQLVSQSVLVKGTDARLSVDSAATLSFPKTMDWFCNGVSPSLVTGAMAFWQESGVFAFDGTSTVSSNKQKETLNQAVARLRSYLQTQGYRETILR